jgi:hypothetical protein
MSTLGTTLTTTMWVIDRVHYGTSDLRATAKPTAPSRLSDCLVLVLQVSDLTNRGHAVPVHLSKLA